MSDIKFCLFELLEVLLEHIAVFLKMIVLCGNKKQHSIACWPRSPGDHALEIQQFPIEGFNESQDDLDKLVEQFIELENKENESVPIIKIIL